jgi:iron complex outermembrane receptor protein
MISATGGQYFEEGGQTYDFSGNIGIPLGDKGFLNITGEKRFRGFSQRGEQDIRVMDANGVSTGAFNATSVPGYPRINHIAGDPQSMLTTVAANMEYQVDPDVLLYANATYGERQAKAYENTRLPGRVRASPGSNQPFNAITNPQGYTGLTPQGTPLLSGSSGTPGVTPGELIPFPNGLFPQEAMREDDYGYTVGIKGSIAGWNWDLSGTYGKDRTKIYTLQSANAALFLDTHTTPRDFYNGQFTASETTFNLDVNKELDFGLASPLTVAFGFEGRENTFAIEQGDAASIYKEGGQSYPGFQPTDAGAHSRKNYAAYIDFAVSPIQDSAGRYCRQVRALHRFRRYPGWKNHRPL